MCYQARANSLPSSVAINLVADRLYNNVERAREGHTLKWKLKRKTRVEIWSQGKKVKVYTSDAIMDLLRSLDSDPDGIVTLGALALTLRAVTVVTGQIVVGEEIDFLNALTDLVIACDGSFDEADDLQLFYEKWLVRYPAAVMKVRTYVNRGETRAFISDTWPERILYSSILEALLRAPKGNSARAWKGKDLYPPKGSDELDWEEPIYDGDYFELVVLDISSFTASCTGSWGLALAIYQAVYRNPRLAMLNEPVILNLRGRLIEVTLLEVLRRYLCMVVGAEALDSTTGETFCHKGGYLGVGANMMLTRLYLVCVLYELQHELRTMGVYNKIQTAGDDQGCFLRGTREMVTLARMKLSEVLTNTVGNIKEVETVSSDNVEEYNLQAPRVEFCKSPVAITFTVKHVGGRAIRFIKIQTIPTTSVGGDEFTGLGKRKIEDSRAIELRESVRIAVAAESTRFARMGEAIVSRELAFQAVHGHVFPERIRWKRAPHLVLGAMGSVEKNSVVYLGSAYLAIQRVLSRSDSLGRNFRTSDKDKTNFLVTLKILKSVRNVTTSGRSVTVVGYQSDLKKAIVDRGESALPVSASIVSVDGLQEMVSSLQNAVLILATE